MALANQNVLVYGTGTSGQGAAKLLTAHGARVFFFDEKTADEEKLLSLLPTASFLSSPLDNENIRDIDLAVLSPGVPTDAPQVQTIKAAGIPVIGEVELAYLCAKGKLLAITGTNGKTTTTALLGAIMEAAQPGGVFIAGNIGKAYTSVADATTDASTTVLEVSSFQLESIEQFHPQVAAILNITEDHLNRHHTMARYAAVKEDICKNQTKDDVCVLNDEDSMLRDFATRCPARVLRFSSRRPVEEGAFLRGEDIILNTEGREGVLLSTKGLRLIGTHNHENIMAAALMAHAAGVADETIAAVVRDFAPVAHRIEYVAEKHGVIWYNDSKGTNPDAAIQGIRAMSRPTFLIGGGYDKGAEYRPWIRAFEGRVKMLVLEGATRFDIRDAACAEGFPEEKIVLFETMAEAMAYCRDHAEAGDAVLLSPACASWGEFPNYEVRGEVFKTYVQEEV